MMIVSISQCLRKSVELQDVSDSPRLDCEVLLGHVLQKERTWLYTWPEYELSADEVKRFHSLLNRRLKGEPIAYILGQREFWSLSLEVNESTLIPRPDTELLVERALQVFDENPQIEFLDLGTGTGAIALAMASEKKQWQGIGVDKSTAAIELAKRNAQRLAVKNITFLVSDWFSELSGKQFDLIVSNPPYIDNNDEHLSLGDVRFEPRSALVAENEGYRDIELICEQAPLYLKKDGWLLFEHGYQQAKRVREILDAAGFTSVETYQDLGGNDRVTAGSLQ